MVFKGNFVVRMFFYLFIALFVVYVSLHDKYPIMHIIQLAIFLGLATGVLYSGKLCFSSLGVAILSHSITVLQRGETLVVRGPDVLSSCGAPGRVLRLQEEYVVGIGGFCSPIGEWSTVSSYSSSELNLLTELASGCPTKGTSNQIQGILHVSFVHLATTILLSSTIGMTYA